eukprot:Colp12_sorted_trinity150504_noHs@11278
MNGMESQKTMMLRRARLKKALRRNPILHFLGSLLKQPTKHWRLYPFKGEEQLPIMHLHRQSAYLFGRERKVADVPVDHPSCSLQHAVLQFRQVTNKKDDGSIVRKISPYLIDLESSNGTFLNGKKIDASRYYELFENDVIKFGFSSREYVLMLAPQG